jgi:hypothetical protein
VRVLDLKLSELHSAVETDPLPKEIGMNLVCARVFAAGIVCAGLLATFASWPVLAADDNAAVLQANQAFDSAVNTRDMASLHKLLDADFTWTTKDGRTLTRAQILRDVPKTLIDYRGYPAEVRQYTYGDVEIAQEMKGKDHVLQVWVKRPAGWQALVYQEVQLLGAPPASTQGASKECVNPCKTVPFKPKTEAERAVITAYQSVETAVTAHDSAAWGALIDDAFFAVTSNSNGPLDKKTRMAGLDHQATGGIAQFPLVSARMFQFGHTMIMTSLQKPEEGKPIHVTRVWIERNGKWLEVYSYQTTIQAAASGN